MSANTRRGGPGVEGQRVGTHSCIHTCIKLQIAAAAVKVLLGAEDGLGDEKVPDRTVEFVAEVLLRAKGDATSSMVPLTNVLYDNPVLTGWSMYSMLTRSFQDH